ncbi:hypothetical protein BDBG_16327 [Blastomyces gilchristii SLH14081]|uniref:Uncharacterized protein n=1 Tax=Blastomyces gilchristii (strain SLH14081) TaxID=559298 RepID=A0A179UBS0_BLAGS|nr:uncharacterized protein BDBG_16327 [Blastomyces gilchristii SLH14081]OAT04748.1 hypothetical protein BDBG_16327 [Blastomyces gilchristii SLH14081]
MCGVASKPTSHGITPLLLDHRDGPISRVHFYTKPTKRYIEPYRQGPMAAKKK